MTEDGHSVALLSGQMTGEQLIVVLNGFREGKEKLLITSQSHVPLCGIDVPQVNGALGFVDRLRYVTMFE